MSTAASIQQFPRISRFAPDGSPRGSILIESALHMERHGSARLIRNRKQCVVACYEISADGLSAGGNSMGAPERAARIPTGQRYSFEQLLRDGHKCWRHKSLPTTRLRNGRQNDADLFVRGVFRRVVLDCVIR